MKKSNLKRSNRTSFFTQLFLFYFAAFGWCNTLNAQSECFPFTLGEEPPNSPPLNAIYFGGGGAGPQDMYYIPTVVHIIHNNGPENISNQAVIDGINIINTKLEQNNVHVKLLLATLDPNGNCVNGITRNQTTKPSCWTNVNDECVYPGNTYQSMINIMNLNRWDPNRYLNIWITKDIQHCYFFPEDGEFGDHQRVQAPSNNPPVIENGGTNFDQYDGFMMAYESWGNGSFRGIASDNYSMRPLGHFLNLYEIWGEFNLLTSCCDPEETTSNEDDVVDTKPCNFIYPFNVFSDYQNMSTINCNNISTECNNAQFCLEDGIPNPEGFWPKENYMGFFYQCQNTFTPGQAQRMYTCLDTYRAELVSPQNLIATGVAQQIIASTTWNAADFIGGIVFIGQDLAINAGVILTINSGVTVKFAENARLIIKPGAKVVLNGSTLTNHCADYWPGVEVWGQASLKQTSANQGFLDMKNGAIIEHAACGVRLGNLASTVPNWTYDWNKTGGIVKSVGSCTFRNNRKDVEFLPYQNFTTTGGQNVLLKNVSRFTDCRFGVTAALPNVTNLSERLSLYDVDGVKFTACFFYISGAGAAAYPMNNRSNAIYSVASSFVVESKCSAYVPLGSECEAGYLTASTLGDPGNDVLPSKFVNFKQAIRAVGVTDFGNISISGTLFLENRMGIYLGGIANASIYRNRFKIAPTGALISYGLSMLGCTGYLVERNSFEGPNEYNQLCVGTWITDSDDEHNEIYLNDFKGLFAGTIAQGRQVLEEDDGHQGLEILCGLYESTKYNIAVTSYSGQDGNIAPIQGFFTLDATEVTLPAGNIFTHTDWGPSYPYTDYYICPNGDCDYVRYEHHDQSSPFNVAPIYYDPEWFINSENLPVMTSRAAACPIDRETNSNSAPNLHSLVLAKRAQAEQMHTNLQSIIDGGATASLVAYVSDPNISSTQIRASLIPIVPYVSNDVLYALIQRAPAMNPWHICEIMIACSPLDAEVLSTLVSANLLPQYLHNLLMGYQSGSNSYLQSQNDLKYQNNTRKQALNNYVRLKLSENEEEYHTEEIREIMTGEQINDAVRVKIGIALQQNNLTEAFALLSDYDAPLGEDAWKEYMGILLTLHANGGFHTATSAQILLLEGIASSGKFGRHQASALLEIITGVQPEEELNIPLEGLRSLSMESELVRPPLVSLFPNPATDLFHITYLLPFEKKSAFIRIFDSMGHLVKEENVTNGFGILELNSIQFESGLYYYDLEVNGHKVASDKFSIIH
jgi:hypothetical protein